jgi:hypothetical protein
MRVLVLCAISAIVLVGCGTPTAPQPAVNQGASSTPPPAGANVATISDTAAVFGGKEVPFPASRAQLVAALGEPSRTLAKVNKIYVWDGQGIYAYSKPDADVVHDISFSFVKEEWDYAPQTPFNGSIQVAGLTINKDTTEAALTGAGYKKDDSYLEKSLGTNIVLIEHEGGLKSLSLSVP